MNEVQSLDSSERTTEPPDSITSGNMCNEWMARLLRVALSASGCLTGHAYHVLNRGTTVPLSFTKNPTTPASSVHIPLLRSSSPGHCDLLA